MEIIYSILIVYTILIAILLLCILLIFHNTSDSYYSDILTRKDFNKKCPDCRDTWYDRIYRKNWMRLIPGTKLYYCNNCRYKFMVIYRRIALKMAYKRLKQMSF
jgi:ribosomal protein L37AE/L43A